MSRRLYTPRRRARDSFDVLKAIAIVSLASCGLFMIAALGAQCGRAIG